MKKPHGNKGHIPWNKGKKGLQQAWNKGKEASLETRNYNNCQQYRTCEAINEPC